MSKYISEPSKFVTVFASLINFLFLFFTLSDNQTLYPQIKILPDEQGIYHTAFTQFYHKDEMITPESVSNFENLVGKKIVWLNFNNDWFNGIHFPKESAENIYSRNVFPSIRLMPWSRYSKFDDTYSLKNIAAGSFDKELLQWAVDAKESNIPILLDFAPEPNGDWFPWCGVSNGAGKKYYRPIEKAVGPKLWCDAYIHVVKIFQKAGAKNVTWIFHVNSVSSPDESWNMIKEYYPGDEYVDWIGVNIYGPQKWGDQYRGFKEILDKCYPQLCSLSSEKPLAIIEFGVADYLPNVNKAVWLQSALYTVMLPEYNRIKAIGWWNSTWYNDDGTISALQIDSSPHSLQTYKEGIAFEKFIGNYKALKQN